MWILILIWFSQFDTYPCNILELGIIMHYYALFKLIHKSGAHQSDSDIVWSLSGSLANWNIQARRYLWQVPWMYQCHKFVTANILRFQMYGFIFDQSVPRFPFGEPQARSAKDDPIVYVVKCLNVSLRWGRWELVECHANKRSSWTASRHFWKYSSHNVFSLFCAQANLDPPKGACSSARLHLCNAFCGCR